MDGALLEVCPVMYMLYVLFNFHYPLQKSRLRVTKKKRKRKRLKQTGKNNLTWYSLLNPVLSFRDIFLICAFIFLTGMFLLVGGPFFVFSGKAYVDSTTSFSWTFSEMKSAIKINAFIFVIMIVLYHPYQNN